MPHRGLSFTQLSFREESKKSGNRGETTKGPDAAWIEKIHRLKAGFLDKSGGLMVMARGRLPPPHHMRKKLIFPLDIMIPMVNNKNMTGQELKEWRRKCGLSQEELGRLLGVARFSVSRWEIGTRTIPSFLHLALEALENRMAKGGKHGHNQETN
jgi:DNA-binding XRE family transcriptional regulator